MGIGDKNGHAGSRFVDHFGQQGHQSCCIKCGPHPAVVKRGVAEDSLIASFQQEGLTLNALCSRYCAWIYERVGSYAETARRLKIDRRTAKKYIDRKPRV
jgi:hypothetical protein